jgi:hypothetical protein
MSKFMHTLAILVILLLFTFVFAHQSAQAGPQVNQTSQLTAADPSAAARFGVAVAVDGDTAVVGAPSAANNALFTGAAYVFERSGNTWTQTDKLVAGDGEAGDLFGAAVAIQGSTILVGANGDDDAGGNAGAVYIFTNSGGWSETDKLLPGEVGDTHFGASIAIDGATIAVGAPYTDSGVTNSGAAYVFEDDGGGWTETERLATGGGGAVLSDLFGWAVDLSGDMLLVGAPLDDVVYVFERGGAGWTETAVLNGTTTQSGDRFGQAVSTDGGRILVGAPQDDDAGTNAGSAFLFAPDGSGWQEEVQLTPTQPTPLTGAAFGSSVAIFGETAVIGAPNSKGVIDAEESGAAYLYEFNGLAWTADILTANVALAFDHLGTAVALNSAGILVGAPDSNLAAVDAGAVYYYAHESAPPPPPPPPPPGDEEVCLSEEQSTEEVLPGVTLTWDSALRCLNAAPQGQYAFTVTLSADSANTTSVIIDDVALTHTTPRPLGVAPTADIDATTGLSLTLAAGGEGAFSVTGSYEMVTTGATQKANLHFCAVGHEETSGELFYMGLNAFLRDTDDEEDDGASPPQPPVISQVAVTPSPIGATITWLTDQPATSEIVYFALDNPGEMMSATQGCLAAQQHTVQISGLQPGTEYQFQAQSRTGEGALATSDEFNFTTTEFSEHVYLPVVQR